MPTPAALRCTSCQHENPAEQKFCGECGARLRAACSVCGHANPAGQRHCGQCGSALALPAGTGNVTPRHLAEKILTSRSAMEGERKQVTVLFSDLKGSMELLADRDPEEARRILDPVLERMIEAVHRYEGTVNQVMGDGIMALFGAPLAHEDHAVRACYAALRMQVSVKVYAEQTRRMVGVEPQIRVGINSGEVVVRSIGSDLHMDYTAVGATTHLASRMEQLAGPGTIRITADTLRLAEGYVNVTPLGPIPVRGYSQPIEAFELTGASSVRTRLQASAGRGLSRFVGRRAELEALHESVVLAGAGNGRVVSVVGEAGVGKSRLVYEFTHSERLEAWLTLETSAVSYGKVTSYLPVVDLLRSYFRLQERDDAREVRAKVMSRVLALDESLRTILQPLLALLDVSHADSEWQRLDPVQRREQTLQALRMLLTAEARVQPVLLIVEDLQWIDGETRALLDALFRDIQGARILLLASHRPDYEHAWEAAPWHLPLRLAPLAPAEIEALLGALVGGDRSLAPLREMLIRTTGGNPFFLEESVRTMVESSALEGERGAYLLTRPLSTIRLPATVQAVLAARIDRLAADEKQLLQLAAVIGKEVPLALLKAVSAEDEDSLRALLARLQAGDYLFETRLFPDVEYGFRHTLTHEVAYGSLLQERRRQLHAQIAATLEQLYSDRIAEHIERLAHHAFLGEVWEKALVYCRQAGVKALERSALRESASWLEEGLEALTRLPESARSVEQAIDIRFDLRAAYIALAAFERVRTLLEEAERLAAGIDDAVRLGRVLGYLGHVSQLMGEPRRAIALCERALGLAEPSGDLQGQIIARQYLAIAGYDAGDYPWVCEVSVMNARLIESTGSVFGRFGMTGMASVFVDAYRAISLAQLGRFDEAEGLAEASLKMAEMSRHAYTRVGVALVAMVHLLRGNAERARAIMEPAIDLARSSAVQFLLPYNLAILGGIATLAGRREDAMDATREALEGLQAGGMRSRRSEVWRLRAAALLASGDTSALQMAEAARGLAAEDSALGEEAWALKTLGDVHAARGALGQDLATDCYLRGLRMSEELQMRPLVAHCHAALGRLAAAAGRVDQVQPHVQLAREMYADMRMHFSAEPLGFGVQMPV
jgi:class 3 adenylate cyclase/tetratricopeptide (TPR) repeat protein